MRAATTTHEVPTQELDDSDDDLEQQFLHVPEQKDLFDMLDVLPSAQNQVLH
jgi:hypothetical protein